MTDDRLVPGTSTVQIASDVAYGHFRSSYVDKTTTTTTKKKTCYPLSAVNIFMRNLDGPYRLSLFSDSIDLATWSKDRISSIQKLNRV